MSQNVDRFTRWLFSLIPLHIQHRLREWGFVRLLNDGAAMFFGPLLTLIKPSIAYMTITWGFRPPILKLSQSKSSPYLEVHKLRSKSPTNNSFIRILLFVHGGAWGSGQLWQYRAAALAYGRELDVNEVMLLKYDYYPRAMILQQRDDVLSALSTISNRYSKVEGDEEDQRERDVQIILCGHSSGANIGALALCSLLDTTSISTSTPLSKNTKIIFVGLAGVYDLVKHYDFEARRNVHEISPMTAGAGGYSHLSLCSPTLLLSSWVASSFSSTSSLSSETASPLPYDYVWKSDVHPNYLEKVHLLHTLQDSTVPYSSSQELAAVCRQLHWPVKEYYYEGEHLHPILEIFFPEKAKNGTIAAVRSIAAHLPNNIA
jgi:acetyl esterase/lipase